MLIIPASGWWNIRLIDRYFHPPNAKLIKSLPLCSIPQSDMLIWPKEKTGIYFVKSGSFARDYIRDFQNLTCIPSCSVCTTPRRWCPPVDDVWKVNFNGAMFGEFDEAGIVVVIRDSRGEVKAALSEKIKKPPTVDVLELLAAKRAMTFSLETGTTRALVEGDSATVIKAIQLGKDDLGTNVKD
ncbi:hypothetical protein CFP56_039662 [Quercus suber]|uniref:RNase H type-1 domain-containing protein n=1 Tax=Quercus suber TaxID=58331 RepID=A0AAW0MA57_QUESU